MIHVLAPQLGPPGGSYTPAVVAGGWVFTAGQVGRDARTGEIPSGLEAQVRLAVQHLHAVLTAAGTSADRIVKTTCYLADISRFDEFDAVYAELFAEPRPARSTVGVALAGELQFEIEAVAMLDAG